MLIQALSPSVLVDRSSSLFLEFVVDLISASLRCIKQHLKSWVTMRNHLWSLAVVLRISHQRRLAVVLQRSHLQSLALVRSGHLRSCGTLLSVPLRSIAICGHPVKCRNRLSEHLRQTVSIGKFLLAPLIVLFIDFCVVGFPDLQVLAKQSPIWLIEVCQDRVQEIMCLGRLLLLLFEKVGQVKDALVGIVRGWCNIRRIGICATDLSFRQLLDQLALIYREKRFGLHFQLANVTD